MTVNIWAVALAAASSFLLGGLWYSSAVSPRPWTKAMNRSGSEDQPHPARVFGLSFLFALLSACLFAMLLGPLPELVRALQMGLIVGMGFVAACFRINYQFANRPFSALLIDGGYLSSQFVLFAVILGLWH